VIVEPQLSKIDMLVYRESSGNLQKILENSSKVLLNYIHSNTIYSDCTPENLNSKNSFNYFL